MVKQKNFRIYNLLNLNFNTVLCMCLILVSLVLLISRNSQRELSERSLDDFAPENRVKFLPVDKRYSIRMTTKPPLKDNIFNASNLESFKKDQQKEIQLTERKEEDEVAENQNPEERNYKEITKSEEEFDQDDEFHPPSGETDLKKSFDKIFNIFRKSKPNENKQNEDLKFSSKFETAPQLFVLGEPHSSSQSSQPVNPGDPHHQNQSFLKTIEEVSETAKLPQEKPNLKTSEGKNLVLINETDQVDFPDETFNTINEKEKTSLDDEYTEPEESLVPRPVSESWVFHALQNPFRKEAADDVKKIYEMFSRRKKVAVGMGDCSNLSRVGGFTDDQKFDPDHSQYLCEDADFEGHFKTGCIIYSFGVNDNWDFENTTASKGCRVWVYDIYTKQKPENLASNIYFFRRGLGTKNEIKLIQNEEVQFSTLEEIIADNNHKKSFISYVKINLKGEEWQILDQIMSEAPLLTNNILQLGLTTHLHSALVDFRLYQKYLNILNKLTALGFQLFYSKEVEIGNESYKEPFLEDKLVVLTNYLAFLRL